MSEEAETKKRDAGRDEQRRKMITERGRETKINKNETLRRERGDKEEENNYE